MTDVTRILSLIKHGDSFAAEQLLPLVYAELRQLAARRMAREAPGQTLQPTALVHEAYVRLVGNEKGKAWENRGHFFAAAAEAMRRILVERARHKQCVKGGGQHGRQEVDLDELQTPDVAEDILEIDDALRAFREVQPLAARLVELRYFGGMSHEEAAAAVGISVRHAHRYWNYAKAWLHDRIKRADTFDRASLILATQD